jgi:hypothetical protein
MANIKKLKREPVVVDIGDGVERKLRYTLNSFALIEEKYGTIDKAMEALQSGSVAAVRFALWVGLVHEDENLSEHYVGSQIDLSDLEDLAEKMNKAMMGDLPQDEVVNPN